MEFTEEAKKGLQKYLDHLKGQKDTTVDLFEFPDLLPQPVVDILMEHLEVETYEDCNRLADLLEPHGYVFDYGLDAVPYNLRKAG